jgi:hypothetical protein
MVDVLQMYRRHSHDNCLACSLIRYGMLSTLFPFLLHVSKQVRQHKVLTIQRNAMRKKTRYAMCCLTKVLIFNAPYILSY